MCRDHVSDEFPRRARPRATIVAVGPPDGELPAGARIDLPLWQTDRHVAWISSVDVFSTGCSIELTCHRKDPDATGAHDLDLMRDLRLGVDWPTDEASPTLPIRGRGTPVPTGPRLHEQGANAGNGEIRRRYWLSTLPTRQTMTFVASWPSQGIDEHRVELDTEEIQTAARQAWAIWTSPDADIRQHPEAGQ